MYISNLKHFLNKKGDTPREMPPEAHEMAWFLAMVVDITTQNRNKELAPSTLRCFNSGCNGIVQTALTPNQKEILLSTTSEKTRTTATLRRQHIPPNVRCYLAGNK